MAAEPRRKCASLCNVECVTARGKADCVRTCVYLCAGGEDGDGNWAVVWSGNYSVISCPFVLSVPLGAAGLSEVRRVRIETRTDIDFYEEIDAVALVQVFAQHRILLV